MQRAHCHEGAIPLYPVRVDGLKPDIEAPMRFSDWNKGHDVAFERAVSVAAGGSIQAPAP